LDALAMIILQKGKKADILRVIQELEKMQGG
jgi:hypothetical protein